MSHGYGRMIRQEGDYTYLRKKGYMTPKRYLLQVMAMGNDLSRGGLYLPQEERIHDSKKVSAPGHGYGGMIYQEEDTYIHLLSNEQRALSQSLVATLLLE